MRLGKREYERDRRTLVLDSADLMDTQAPYPEVYDFDKGRKPFPVSSFGNDDWGNCVKVCQTQHTFRLERVERRTTPRISPPDVIQAYKDECLRQFGVAPVYAGDDNDGGLVVIKNLRNWRTIGWPVYLAQKAKKQTVQKIFAFGELRGDQSQLRRACYLLNGIEFGFDLPLTAKAQFRNGQPWDVVPDNSPATRPGSWGGHCVYGWRYEKGGWWVKTWGKDHPVTDAFVDKYADEKWAVVDDQDPLGKISKWLDVPTMVTKLQGIGVAISG